MPTPIVTKYIKNATGITLSPNTFVANNANIITTPTKIIEIPIANDFVNLLLPWSTSSSEYTLAITGFFFLKLSIIVPLIINIGTAKTTPIKTITTPINAYVSSACSFGAKPNNVSIIDTPTNIILTPKAIPLAAFENTVS